MSANKLPLDPLRIYIQAERFLFADEKLRSREVLAAPEIGAYVALPCVVMAAFSIEVYFKCLICIEGHPVPRGHHLKNLFDRLNGKTQKELAALWSADNERRNEFRVQLPPPWRDKVSDDVPGGIVARCPAHLRNSDMHTRASPPAVFTSTPCQECFGK